MSKVGQFADGRWVGVKNCENLPTSSMDGPYVKSLKEFSFSSSFQLSPKLVDLRMRSRGFMKKLRFILTYLFMLNYSMIFASSLDSETEKKNHYCVHFFSLSENDPV